MDPIRWPDLPEPYNHALREAVAYVLERYKPAGIIAAGSAVRGIPDRSSDIDLYVIHLEPFRQRLQRFFNAVPVEIFINPPQQVERYLEEEQAEGTPITAHMLAKGVVLLQNDPVTGQLISRAAELLAQPPHYPPSSLLYQRYLVACLYEDALDLVGKDAPAANLLLPKAVGGMIEYFYRHTGCFVPRIKETISRLESLDPEVHRLAVEFTSAASLGERLRLAELLAERTIGVKGFFEWESEPLAVK
jgi:predicted nucleotidyltransferase